MDVMLLKANRDRRVEKLRTITLLKEGANFSFKIMGKEMVAHNEKYEWLAKEQFGSRKGHNAILHGLNKNLFYDIVRQSSVSASVFCNDASQCYNRIAHPTMAAILKKCGIPESTITSLLNTVEHMKHHIRTSKGDSETHFEGSQWEIPPQGVIQDRGDAPAIWATIISFLLNIMDNEKLGAQITSTISRSTKNIVGFSFVDDTDLLNIDLGT